jgi:hypothetical protein
MTTFFREFSRVKPHFRPQMMLTSLGWCPAQPTHTLLLLFSFQPVVQFQLLVHPVEACLHCIVELFVIESTVWPLLQQLYSAFQTPTSTCLHTFLVPHLLLYSYDNSAWNEVIRGEGRMGGAFNSNGEKRYSYRIVMGKLEGK